MKLLHLITTLDVGGAEMYLLKQVAGMSRRGLEVRVAYLKGQGTLCADFERAGAAAVIALPSNPLAAALELRRQMRWADLVHTHLLKADMLGALVALCTGRRAQLLSGKHNDEQVLRRPLVSAVHHVLGRVPARTIVLSDHVGTFFERYGGVPRKRQRRVYYGIEAQPFERAAAAPAAERSALRASLGLGPEHCAFVCVARFAPQKAHSVLLRALDRARREPDGERLRLLLVGDDPFGDGRQRAQGLADELQLGKQVSFLGIRRDVPELLAASEVFTMASLWEGLGLVFLEAMACGLPVLATDVSAVPEVVRHEETGLLVPPNQEVPLAQAMLRLARDAQLRARLGQAGHARVLANFGLETMLAGTLAVYRELQTRP